MVLTVERAEALTCGRRSLTGWVELEFVVNEAGRVERAVITSSSNEVFDRAALDAINRWRFEPELENGRAVPVQAALKFTFAL